MKKWICLVAFVGIFAASARGQHSLALADLVITHARLITGTGLVQDKAGIVIEDKRITAVVTGNGVRSAKTTVDASGRTVLPGLIDTHVHLLAADKVTNKEELARYIEEVVRGNLIGFLAHGVTTLKSIGDPEDGILELRAKVESGQLRGPRLLAVGPAFTAINGHPSATVYGKNPWQRQHSTVEVATAEEARKALARLASKEVNAIKLVYEGSDDPANPYPNIWGLDTIPRLPKEAMLAIVDEAHQQGLRVTAHTVEEESAMAAVKAGVDGLEHGVSQVGSTVSEELIEILRERGIFYVPTLQVFEILAPQVLASAKPNLQKVSEGGVRIASGSDTFGELAAGARVIREAELMVEAGLSPAAVIQAATRNAAEHLGLGSELGTLEPGKLADLIIVDGNPLEDLSALKQVWLVIKDGEIVVDKRGAASQ